MGHPSVVVDSRASSAHGSVDVPIRYSIANGQPPSGGQPEAPQPQVAQWEVIPQGAGTGLLVPASPTAVAPVPPILATRADSTASPAREGTPHRPSRDNSGTLPSEDGRSETNRTWLSRVTDRTKLLREMFELEPTENVMDDFVCALKKRILLQGRMYVFEHYVCFHSNVLGYVKNKIIPLKEVTAVRKRKNVGFPNSIEITWGADGKREFFTSFLSREDAYRLIMATWASCSGYANLFNDSRQDADTSNSGGGGRRRHRLHGHSTTAADIINALRSSSESTDGLHARDSFLQKSAKLFRPVPRRRATDLGIPIAATGMAAGDGSAGRGSAAGPATAGPEASAASADGPPFGASRTARLRGRNGDSASVTEAAAAYSDVDVDPDPDADIDLDADADVDAVDQESTRTLSIDQTDEDDNPSYRNDSDDNSTAEPADDQVWTPQPMPPPPVNPAMQRLVQGEIAGVDVRSYCQTFMADGVPFFIDFHLAKGDEQVQLSPWRNHHNMGRVRELQFVTQLKSRIGPPKAMCYQTQKYTMYQGDVFVYETSQVMPDIPYGDCFTVESRWNVTNMAPAPDGIPRVNVETFVMVDFARSTIWKKAIESGVIASCRSAHEEFLKAAKAIAESGNAVSFSSSRAPSVRGSGSVDGGNGRPPAAAAADFAAKQQRPKALRESAASVHGGAGSPASQQGDLPSPSGSPLSDAQLRAFLGQVGPDQRRDLLRLLRVSPPGPASPKRASSPSLSGRGPSDPGTGVGFRLPSVMEGGAAGPVAPVPAAVAPAATLPRQQRLARLQTPLLLALGACVVLLQVLILSGWFRPAGSPPTATSGSSMSSWTPPRSGSVDCSAPGSMPGEPLWSGEASGSGSASGWAPYWAGRFELLQQDMQTLQRRMEFLRGEVMAAVTSGRWEPTVTDAATGIHNEL